MPHSSRPSLLATATLLCVLAGALFSPPIDAQTSGIEVHGHWTITVREPDGTLVSRTEFQNALVHSGQNSLALLLDGSILAQYWRVELAAPSGGTEPCTDSATDLPCIVTNGPTTMTSEFQNLSVGTDVSVTMTILEGQATAANTTAIGSVGTFMVSNHGTTREFTRKELAAPPAVQAGQIVQVRVEFSFS